MRAAPSLLVPVAVGAALRTAAALVRPAWHDEYFTAFLAAMSPDRILAALRLDSGPPLPYLAAAAVAHLGLPPLAAARLVSVLAGTSAVVIAALAARKAFGHTAALWCAAVLAIHPLALSWSAEGRAYALLMLASAWVWERLETIRLGGRARALALPVALAAWSHGLGLAVAGAALVAAWTYPRESRRRALAAVGAGLATLLPWLPVAAAQPAAAIAWMTESFARLPVLDRAAAPVLLLSPVSVFGASVDLPSAPVAVAVTAAALFAVLMVVGARPVNRGRVAVLLAAVPAAGLTVMAWAGAPAFFPGRTEAAFLVPAVGLAAAAAARRRTAAAVLLVLTAAGAATDGLALIRWRTAPPPPEARLAAVISERLPAGGTVVTTGYWQLGLRYRLPADFAVEGFSRESALHPGWFQPELDRPAPGEAAALAERLAADRAAGHGIALVVSGTSAAAESLRAVAAALGLAAVARAPGVTVFASSGATPEGARG